jgi:hypothetical protein
MDNFTLEDISTARRVIRGACLSSIGKVAARAVARGVAGFVVGLLLFRLLLPQSNFHVWALSLALLFLAITLVGVGIFGMSMSKDYLSANSRLQQLELRVRSGEQVAKPPQPSSIAKAHVADA